MKPNKSQAISLTIMLSFMIIILASCAGQTTFTKIWYDVDPSTPKSQTKENITIDIDYIEKSTQTLLNYPMFWAPRKSLPTEKGAWGAISNEVNGELAYDFPGMSVFAVSLKNETGHILRMRDARVYLVIGGETYPAIQKSELMEAGAPEDQAWRIELKELVVRNRGVKLVNDFATEILPGMSYSGFIMFEIDPSLAERGVLSFFDMTTETDQAGNPVKKTTFEWKIIQKQAVVTR